MADAVVSERIVIAEMILLILDVILRIVHKNIKTSSERMLHLHKASLLVVNCLEQKFCISKYIG